MEPQKIYEVKKMIDILKNADCSDAFCCIFNATGFNEDHMFGCFARYPHGDPKEEDRGCIAYQAAKMLEELLNKQEK